MEGIVCKNCGSNSLQFKHGFWVCDYCDTRFVPTELTGGQTISYGGGSSRSFGGSGGSQISVSSDVENLLQKCRLNPKKARKYANLILDIDPDNKEALKYL